MLFIYILHNYKMYHKLNSMNQHNYNTFEGSDKIVNPTSFIKCGFTCAIFITLLCLAFNLFGLSVGIIHNNATCYENKNVMSLTEWLKIVTSVSIVSNIVLLVFVTIQYLFGMENPKVMMLSCAPFTCYMVFSSFFTLAMNILCCVELAYQFPSCHQEVPIVTTTSIIIMARLAKAGPNTLTTIAGSVWGMTWPISIMMVSWIW